MKTEKAGLDTIFLTAVAIASDEKRAAYIAQACGDQRELRARVEKLVAPHSDAGTTEPILDFRMQNADCKSEISNLQSAIPQGRPYFVMELVKGVPITEYCDANRLTPRARLELFSQACSAVQHAHQKGIIHRD